MTGSRLVVLALLLVTLGLLLLNLFTVVDVLRIEPVEPEVVQEGPLSFVQSSRLRRTLDESGRGPLAISATLALLPFWLGTLGAAAAVWRFLVKRQTRREGEDFERARKRTARTWELLVRHGHHLASARNRVEREDRAGELRRELYRHLKVLEGRDRNRLVRFLQHLGQSEGTLDDLRDREGEGRPRRTGHPLEGAVRPAVVLLAVTSLFLLCFGILGTAGMLLVGEELMEFHAGSGFRFGTHEASMGMLVSCQLALLAACAASGLRVLHRRGREERDRRAGTEREDRRRVLEQVEELVAGLARERGPEGNPSFSDADLLPGVVEGIVVLLLPELDGTDQGRLVGSLAERGLLGEIDLRGVDLSGIDLAGADLPGVVLTGCDLGRARLSGARLTGADLAGARLEEADLGGADLCGANLYRAVLWYARLQAADLRDACLVEAALDGANLWNADLRGADLEGARVTAEQLAAAEATEAP